METVLKGLNPAQYSAVTSEAAVLQVLAPPGSGKTKTLTTRVAYLIAYAHLKPWNILVCTFTVKASKEMKERLKCLVGDVQARQLQLGTFHSIALRYLKQYGHLIDLPKDFGIADSADSKAIVTRILKKTNCTMTPGSARSRISSQKACGVDSMTFVATAKGSEQREFAVIYEQYDEALRASKLLDYDDLLLYCLELLRRYPACVSNIEAVLIDEFQDTNNIQFTLMSLFAQRRNHITIVGDPDQSIYGFRAAEIANLVRMRERWSDTVVINLAENYRSSGAILVAAQNIIEQDTSRPAKSLQATHSLGQQPVFRHLPTPFAEAEWLVSEVKRMQALTGGLLKSGDFAVLLRAASLSRILESALCRAGIPYRMVGGVRFYNRVEVKLLIDYLRVVHQPHDDEAVERTLNVPARKIGDTSIKALQQIAKDGLTSLWSVVLDIVQGRRRSGIKLSDPSIKGLALYVNVIMSARNKAGLMGDGQATFVDLVNLVIKKIDMQRWLKSKYPDDHESRWANVEEVIVQATEMSDPDKLARMIAENLLPTIDGLNQTSNAEDLDIMSLFLSNVALSATAEELADQDSAASSQLTISTIHAAKGLEWPVVFIPACYEGSIPHSRAEDNDEERRLLYVGMTRAQVLLYLSRPINSPQRDATTPSQFLSTSTSSALFEAHGPSITASSLAGLATTLGRICPTTSDVQQSRRNLIQDEDNYWPLNGELPLGAMSRQELERAINESSMSGQNTTRTVKGFSIGSENQIAARTTMSDVKARPGFASVAVQYDELMEQARLKSKPAQINDPSSGHQLLKTTKNIKDNRQGTISGFFSSRSDCSVLQRASGNIEDTTSVSDLPAPSSFARKRPFEDTTAQHGQVRPPPTYKIRSTPLQSIDNNRRAKVERSTAYVFLSSSPQKSSPEPASLQNGDEGVVKTSDLTSNGIRPASSLHVTTVQSSGAQRKTLGMRRSLHGWRPNAVKRSETD